MDMLKDSNERLEIPVASTPSEVADCRTAAEGYEIPGFLLRPSFLSEEIGQSTSKLVRIVNGLDATSRYKVATSSEARRRFGLDKLTEYVMKAFGIGESGTLDFSVRETKLGKEIGAHTDVGFTGLSAHFDCSRRRAPNRPVELMLINRLIRDELWYLSSFRSPETDGPIYTDVLQRGGLLVMRQFGRDEQGIRGTAHNFGGYGKWVRIAQG